MTGTLQRALYQAASLTFEELGLLFAAPEDDSLGESAPPSAPAQTASVAFEGPFRGRLVVSLSEGVLPVIASNMLGEEEPPTLDQQQDALGEIANVISGNALPRVAGSKAVFYLAAPQFGGGLAAHPAETLLAQVCVPLEEGEAGLQLFVDAAGAAALRGSAQ